MKALLVRSIWSDPYKNLALEEYIYTRCLEKEFFCLLLWQNKNTVVIGRNQLPEDECIYEVLEKHKIRLVRRMTGGGAVYHDMGNLNFSIICPGKYYDKKRSMHVIKKALLQFGILAEYSGRNDLLAENKKISGNAFLVHPKAGLHHGTILFNTDLNIMNEVLNVPQEKLTHIGISSVKSRVTNLTDLNPDISISALENTIEKCFLEEYETDQRELWSKEQLIHLLSEQTFKTFYSKYQSREWTYKKSSNGRIKMKKKFPWGLCEIYLSINKQKIEYCSIVSDCLYQELISRLEIWLIDKMPASLQKKNLLPFNNITQEEQTIWENIVNMILLLSEEVPEDTEQQNWQ